MNSENARTAAQVCVGECDHLPHGACKSCIIEDLESYAESRAREMIDNLALCAGKDPLADKIAAEGYKAGQEAMRERIINLLKCECTDKICEFRTAQKVIRSLSIDVI